MVVRLGIRRGRRHERGATPPRIDIAGRLGENGGGTRPTPGMYSMTLRNALKTLLVLVLALPLLAAVLVWVVGLLRAMGDDGGALVVGYVGTACQVVWLVCLVGLLVTLALAALQEPGRGHDRPGTEEQDLE
jgi:hypothetical protein